MRVLIIDNMKDTDFGQVGVALAEVGAELDICRPWKARPCPNMPMAMTRWLPSAANRARSTTIPIPTFLRWLN